MASLIEIFCDFDGTITKVDSVDVLLEQLADPAWHDIEAQWERGEIGSRECMARQIALFRGGWKAVEGALAGIEVDPTFASFVEWCREAGIAFTVVSDGLDRTINHILAREGVKVDKVIANHVVEGSDGSLSLEFPHRAEVFDCGSGVCKCEVVQGTGLGRVKIFIGDGRSDFCCAGKSDYLFAKWKLLKHCQDNSINCIPFSDFDDVRLVLEEEFLSVSRSERVEPLVSLSVSKAS